MKKNILSQIIVSIVLFSITVSFTSMINSPSDQTVKSNSPRTQVYVDAVEGPTSVQGDGYFAASPVYSEGVCDYIWVVGGGGYTIDAHRHLAHIYFYNNGDYNVGCGTANSLGNLSQAPIFLKVHVGSYFMATYNPSNQSITVGERETPTMQNINRTTVNSVIQCELYNCMTGALVVKKEVRNNASIDVSNMSKGAYVLKMQVDKNKFESYKMMIQ